MAWFTVALGMFVLSVALDVGAGNQVHFLSDEYIENLNKQDLPWKAGRNFPSNLSQADVEQIFGSRPTPGVLPELPAPNEQRVSYGSGGLGETIPKEFDARQHFKDCSPIISTISDQGACASSYAFSVASVASDRLCIASQGRVKKLLSAEYITACCNMCRYPDQKKRCASGLSSSTWGWVHKRGLVTGGGYKSNIGCQPVSFPPCNHSPHSSPSPSCKDLAPPSPVCHTRCTNEHYARGFFQDKFKFKRYYWLTEAVADIQQEILRNGPVLANMYIYSDLLNYKTGVYTVSGDATLLAYASVKLIGWGEESGHAYWTVVSTFGQGWGNGGTFRILRGRNEAIIESLVNTASPRGNYVTVPEGYGVEEEEEE